jgi:hypothetical protein
VHCADERGFFFENQVFFPTNFLYLVWLKDWNNIPWL